MHILGCMNEVLNSHREEMSAHAPRFITSQDQSGQDSRRDRQGRRDYPHPDRRDRGTIDIQDDGTVKIASTDQAAGLEAKRRIEELTADIEVGRQYTGKVAKIMDFGAFVSILPGRDGLVHISQISDERVENVGDFLSEGDSVTVRVLEVDKQGRIRLSMKAVESES